MVTTHDMPDDTDHDNLYTLEALLRLAASDEDGQEPAVALDAGPLRLLLARIGWDQNPVVHLQYDPEHDELIAEMLHLPTAADYCIGDMLSVGFDRADRHGMPTTLCLDGFHTEPQSRAANLARQVLGDVVWGHAYDLMAIGGGQREVVLDEVEKTRLVRQWATLTANLPLEPESDQDVVDGLTTRQRVGADRNERRRYAVGFELTPYKIRSVLVDESGQGLACQSQRLDSMEPGDVIAQASALAQQLVADHTDAEFLPDRVALGLELGGPVDPAGNVLLFRKQLFQPETWDTPVWRNVPLRQLFEERTGLRARVLNDGSAHAIFEQWFGVGRHASSYAVVLIREGVGGGAVIGGELLERAVEIGHIPAYPEGGNECDCKNIGCLEVVAGITGIVRGARYHDDTIADIEAVARLFNNPHARELTRRLLREAGYGSARATATLIQMLGPLQYVVVYGPSALLDEEHGEAARYFLEHIRKYKEFVAHDDFKDCELKLRTGWAEAGSHGAAVAALQQAFKINPTVVDAAVSTVEEVR